MEDRITANTTTLETVGIMSEGNPGALRVCLELIKSKNSILLLHLDGLRIYGSDIWLCYKDICNLDINLLSKTIIDGNIKRKLNELKLGFSSIK